MSIAETVAPTQEKPLRLWPGVVAAVLTCVVRFGIPMVEPEAVGVGMIGSVIGAAVILVWWVFFSRAPWSERLGAVVLMASGCSRPRDSSTSRSPGPGWGGCSTSWGFPSCASPSWPGPQPAVASLAGLGARRWWPPSCLVAGYSRSCAPAASPPASSVRSSTGGGHRLPRNGCSPEPADEEKQLPPAPATAETPRRPRGRSLRRSLQQPRSTTRRQALPATPSAATSTPAPAAAGGDGSRLAGLPRSRARQHRSRRDDRDGLVEVAARRALAPADRTGLVVLRGQGRPLLHPGAARRRRDRRVLQGLDGRARVEAP